MKSKQKILIVEDDLNNHVLYRDAFENSGFEVIICQNADGDFIDEVKKFEPDIISMDLMIGKEGVEIKRDGFTATGVLKSDPGTSDIPIIVLSNFFQDDKVRRAKELGAVDFLNAQGQDIKKIPEQYLQYLKSPKSYIPSHPIFREE